jgi:glutamate synthase (NADPH/NADH) small chain
MQEIPGTEFEIPADLVLLALGFVHPVHEGLIEDLALKLDARGNVAADSRSFATNQPGVFAAGDCRRGQSLVVWALWEGREAAREVDMHLMGESRLQSRQAHV